MIIDESKYSHLRRESLIAIIKKQEEEEKQKKAEKNRAANKRYWLKRPEELKKRNKEYSEFSKEIKKESGRKHYLKNREKIKARSAIRRKENPEYIRQWTFNKKRSDPVFAMACRLRSRLRCFLNCSGFKKSSKTSEMLGCSFEFFKSHIEASFEKGMSWKNSKEWHLDHTIPLCSARNEKELLNLCHFSNIRPMWKKDNLEKGGKIIDCQPELLLSMKS